MPLRNKEIRVKLHEEGYKKLRRVATRECRSITKQVTLYILRGMEVDEADGRKKR